MNSNTPITLLILAGGLGSRYKGNKQIDGVGPNNEFLLEYAIHDAIEAGFTKVVIVVNASVRNWIEERLESVSERIQLCFVEQLIPILRDAQKRAKPWGTGHAVHVANTAIAEPFMVINADDFYGRSTFEMGAEFLRSKKLNLSEMGMITFPLGKTLTEFGSVSRGLCVVEEDGILSEIIEHEQVERQGGKIVSSAGSDLELDENAPVSMNCWLFHPYIFELLEISFNRFYQEYALSLTEEFYLPFAVQEAIEKNAVFVQVLNSDGEWFGLTYPEDKTKATEYLQALVDANVYPNQL